MTAKIKKTWCSDPECTCYGEPSENFQCRGHKIHAGSLREACLLEIERLNLKETDDLKLLRAIERDIRIWKDSKVEEEG